MGIALCSRMLVRDAMSSNPIVIDADASLGEALDILQSNSIRHLPVVKGGALVGMISDRDLQSLVPRIVDAEALERLMARYDEPVSSVMATDVETLHLEQELDESIDVMLEFKVGALPVIDPSSKSVVGILSYIDVLRALRG